MPHPTAFPLTDPLAAFPESLEPEPPADAREALDAFITARAEAERAFAHLDEQAGPLAQEAAVRDRAEISMLQAAVVSLTNGAAR